MIQIAFPTAFALLIWWLSTGIILYMIGLNRKTYPYTLVIFGVLLIAALSALYQTRNGDAAWDAYVAFTGAVIVWGFIEVTFLTGVVTGSRKTPCPPGSTGWRRARYATEAIIFHELALVAAGLAVIAATWNGINPFGVATFAVLWIMRLSSKFNLFLGVRTLNDELLPAQLRHLRTYFMRRRMNPLFPVSVFVAATLMVFLILRGTAPEAGEFERAGLMLLATLVALALIEHVFMMIPYPIARLWGLKRRITTPLAADTEFCGVTPSTIRSLRAASRGKQ